MPETIADTSATPNAADAAVAASAAEKVAADKAAADATTAAAAAARPAFEAQAAKEKADADAKAIADKAAADKAAADAAAVTYDLKVPEGSKLDAAFVERTAAIARALGLDQKGAEKLLAERATDATERTTQQAATVAAFKPGGALWEKRDTEYRTAALADKDLGAGDQGKLDASIEKVQIALAKFGDDELRADLKDSGWGSKPSVLRLLAKIGRAMGEGQQIAGNAAGGVAKKSDAQVMFPNMYNPDGSPKT